MYAVTYMVNQKESPTKANERHVEIQNVYRKNGKII